MGQRPNAVAATSTYEALVRLTTPEARLSRRRRRVQGSRRSAPHFGRGRRRVGPSIGGSSRLHSPVISRVLRPRVKNDHAQRIVTTIRFANPMRYRMWMPSHIAQAMKPDSCPNGPSHRCWPRRATARSWPHHPCPVAERLRRLAGEAPADLAGDVRALLDRRRRDPGHGRPSSRFAIARSPTTKISGWPGIVRSSVTSIRPARSGSMPVASATIRPNDAACTPAAQSTVRAGIRSSLPSACATITPCSSMR